MEGGESLVNNKGILGLWESAKRLIRGRGGSRKTESSEKPKASLEKLKLDEEAIRRVFETAAKLLEKMNFSPEEKFTLPVSPEGGVEAKAMAELMTVNMEKEQLKQKLARN